MTYRDDDRYQDILAQEAAEEFDKEQNRIASDSAAAIADVDAKIDAEHEAEMLHCPKCGSELKYFNDYGSEYFYCPRCNDTAYNEKGEEIGKIE
jgi:transcription initiation factor IIE alpha subunit